MPSDSLRAARAFLPEAGLPILIAEAIVLGLCTGDTVSLPFQNALAMGDAPSA